MGIDPFRSESQVAEEQIYISNCIASRLDEPTHHDKRVLAIGCKRVPRLFMDEATKRRQTET
jgi:hypothetical protein